MKFNEQDMAKLISEVENEFEQFLAKNEKQEVTPSKEEITYDESDIKEMNELYGSMTKSEKEAHYAAVKKVLFGEEDKSNDVKKSEVEAKDEDKISKSEVETLKIDLENSKKESDDLKKSVDTLASIVAKFVKKAPARKAVTQLGDIQIIKKSEEESATPTEQKVDYSKLPKVEINKILSKKIRDGEIKKSEDKENINKFCFGQINFEEIKYLL